MGVNYNDYDIDIDMLDKNIKRLKAEITIFKYQKRKRSGIDARAILLNIKKLCHSMRIKIHEDLVNMPVVKRNIPKEIIEQAKEKRRITNEMKKGKKK